MFSCKNKPAETVEPVSEFIEITKAQFESEKMEFAEPALSSFSELVHFTGTIIPSVNGKAQISLPTQGVITRIYCKPGQLINKGTVLFEVAGNDFIDLQREYAESSAMFQRLKSEYDRLKELNAENIGTKKELILAESSYNAEKARLNALKLKLQYIGLDINKIEEGMFFSSFQMRAPISGHITSINTNIGQYVESQQTIAEITDSESFQLKLSVFEKDINKVKPGQNAGFYLSGNKAVKFNAKLISVGKLINTDTKSVDCFAELQNFETEQLVSNQFVEGDVVVASDSVLSVPEAAVLKSENDMFVLTFEKENNEIIFLSKTKINAGRLNDGKIELTDYSGSKKILVKGAYNLRIE
jgi:cobalt-zinc-cadmium efflux system membrane fusion protein